MRRAYLVAAAALVAGCYNPSFDNPTCPTGECPSGFACVQGQCVQGNGDIDAPNADTPTDGPGMDTPTGDAIDAPTDAPTDAPGDGTPIDAPTDSSIDAPPITHIGSITVAETGLLNASGGFNVIGQGVVITPKFQTTSFDPPVLDTNPGSPVGCKVYVRDNAAEIAGTVGLNQGSVQVTVTGNGAITTIPTYPPCTYATGVGYRCPDPGSSSNIVGGGSVTFQPMAGFSVMTISGLSASFANEDVGRWVRFTGTTSPQVEGREGAILNVINANSVAISLPVTTVETISSGNFTTFAGYAIQPSLADPGQLADNATMTVAVNGTANGGMNNFGSFNATFTNVGDDFTIDDVNASVLRSIPDDGSAFTLTCNTCGSANAMVLNILTTDGLVTGDPYAFPPASSKQVEVVCTALAATSITVPANVSAFLTVAMSNRQRTRALLLRLELQVPATTAGSSMSVLAGHALLGFTPR